MYRFRGDLVAAHRHGVLALELATVAADPDTAAFALSDLASRPPTRASRRNARHEAQLAG